MTDEFFEVDGARLAYERAGSGPVVIQAHGMSSSRRQDVALGLDLSAVTSDFTLVRYDARGHGESTGRPVPEDYAWPHLALDLLAFRESVSPEDPVDAVGASMGTATVLTAAIAHPDAFRRLVLFIPPTAWATRAAQGDQYRAGADLVEQRGAAFMAEFAAANDMVPPIQRDNPDFEGMLPQVSDELLPSVMRGAALSNLPDADVLAGLAHPTLIVAWPDDPVHPLTTAQTLADVMPNATLEIVTTWPDLRSVGEKVRKFLLS